MKWFGFEKYQACLFLLNVSYGLCSGNLANDVNTSSEQNMTFGKMGTKTRETDQKVDIEIWIQNDRTLTVL